MHMHARIRFHIREVFQIRLIARSILRNQVGRHLKKPNHSKLKQRFMIFFQENLILLSRINLQDNISVSLCYKFIFNVQELGRKCQLK